MPVRATSAAPSGRRSASGAAFDVLICGASFAGLAVARELRATRRAGAGARPLRDRRAADLRVRRADRVAGATRASRASIRQTFGSLVVHTPRATRALAAAVDVLDVRLPRAVRGCCGSSAGDGGVRDREGGRARRAHVVHTDRGDVTAPLIVDALGWRRVLGPGANVQPPDAPLSRGLEVHPAGAGADLELWMDPRYVSPGYGWSFPARDELRIGVGSFDPRVHVKEPTLQLVERCRRRRRALPGQLDPAPAARRGRGRRVLRRRLAPATACR